MKGKEYELRKIIEAKKNESIHHSQSIQSEKKFKKSPG
jgi:hypothetical protein